MRERRDPHIFIESCMKTLVFLQIDLNPLPKPVGIHIQSSYDKQHKHLTIRYMVNTHTHTLISLYI